MPAEPTAENLLIPEQCIELTVAATREEERGRGIGQALTAHGLAWAHSAGYIYCETDWRMTNLLASRF
jgi:GNAT superfamily N-acetyltransferase